jgi:tetratricopeptide (TPR) repeat protein
MGDPARAAEVHSRALAIREAALGEDHPDVAESLYNLGKVRHAIGEATGAQAAFERALAIFEKALGPDHPTVAYPLFGLATLALSQGRATAAVELAERSLALREAAAVPATERAESQLLLAMALWKVGEHRARAVAQAEAAREVASEGGEPAATMLAEIDRWLASHRADR